MSYNVLGDSSDYTWKPESNGEIDYDTELLIYTSVSVKIYHPLLDFLIVFMARLDIVYLWYSF